MPPIVTRRPSAPPHTTTTLATTTTATTTSNSDFGAMQLQPVKPFNMISVLLLSSSATAGPAATELTLSSAADFVGAGGTLMPIGHNVEASVTTDAPFGTALRSGMRNAGSGHPILRPNGASAGIAALLAPGARQLQRCFGPSRVHAPCSARGHACGTLIGACNPLVLVTIRVKI